jgi:hypothetical protein
MPLRIHWFPSDCRQFKICMKQTFELVGFTACSHGSREGKRPRASHIDHAGPPHLGRWFGRSFAGMLWRVAVQVNEFGGGYCSFAYSALASFRMEVSGSASFQSSRNEGQAAATFIAAIPLCAPVRRSADRSEVDPSRNRFLAQSGCCRVPDRQC